MVTIRVGTKAAWQEALRDAVRDVGELFRLLDLPPAWIEKAERAARSFPLVVPRGFVRRMRAGDTNDPLLRQVLPLREELDRIEGYRLDPLEERDREVVPGMLQKYAGRALIVATGACAVHCRYCFRRHFPYGDHPAFASGWPRVVDAIRGDASLSEVILSGGDPLYLPDDQLGAFAAQVDAIAHVRRLRIHTRLPIVIPERVDDSLLSWSGSLRVQVFAVVHANHPNEIDRDVAAAVRRWAGRGVTLLNQSVLLRGINDSVPVLKELSERLLDCGALPYYLHQLDPVHGAAHFATEPELGVRLINQLRADLPGYAVPRFVREVPGVSNKVVLA